MNATASMEGEKVMTDYQFKTILKMVLDIAENTDNIEKIRESLRELIGEMRAEREPEE
jgi:uncharacterized coiled-coil protein SlyX